MVAATKWRSEEMLPLATWPSTVDHAFVDSTRKTSIPCAETHMTSSNAEDANGLQCL